MFLLPLIVTSVGVIDTAAADIAKADTATNIIIFFTFCFLSVFSSIYGETMQVLTKGARRR